MKFPWRIIGHHKILEKLEKEFEEKKLSHSYLFSGPREIGKFFLVKTFSELLQCEHGNLCRNCPSCIQVEKNIHPSTTVVDELWMKDKMEDFEELAKYSNFDQSHRKKTGKKSDQIGIDDVLEFTASLSQKTNSAYKVCLVRNIERMTEEAMNAFLKILEEPPEKTIFLLTTTHQEMLLPTIVSRTRVIELGLTPNSILEERLAEPDFGNFSAAEKEKILTLSQGRPARLLRFRDDPEFLRTQDQFFSDLARMLQKKNLPELFNFAAELAEPQASDRLSEFLEGLIYFLRTLLREKTFGKGLFLTQEFSSAELLAILAMTELTQKRLESNVNKRLALEQLFLSFVEPTT